MRIKYIPALGIAVFLTQAFQILFVHGICPLIMSSQQKFPLPICQLTPISLKRVQSTTDFMPETLPEPLSRLITASWHETRNILSRQCDALCAYFQPAEMQPFGLCR